MFENAFKILWKFYKKNNNGSHGNFSVSKLISIEWYWYKNVDKTLLFIVRLVEKDFSLK